MYLFVQDDDLLEGERKYCGATTLLSKLEKLNINPRRYELPRPYILTPQEVIYWADELMKEVNQKKHCEEVLYITKVCQSLRSWGTNGWLIHVR